MSTLSDNICKAFYTLRSQNWDTLFHEWKLPTLLGEGGSYHYNITWTSCMFTSSVSPKEDEGTLNYSTKDNIFMITKQNSRGLKLERINHPYASLIIAS